MGVLNATKLADGLSPQRLADFLNAELQKAIALSPLCEIDYSLVGTPGDTLTFPAWSYIGDAETPEEGAALTVSKLTKSTKEVKIKKYAKMVELTDELLLSSAGNPYFESLRQIIMAIGSKIDNDFFTVASAGTKIFTTTTLKGLSVKEVWAAKGLFGEKMAERGYLFASSNVILKLMEDDKFDKSPDLSTALIKDGVVGSVGGCLVIPTEKLSTKALIIKPGALRLVLKRDILLEEDREIGVATQLAGTKHAVPYLYDESKVCVINIKQA